MNSIISILIIITSLLNSIFASNFKRKNYIYGLICYLLMGLVAYKNQIYGMFFFYIFIFSPLQIFGFINWNKKDKNNNLEVRCFSNKNRILTITSCIILSLSFAFILQKIPGAKFTYLDAFSNIINLCGVILLALRFNESWWLWLINNVLDVILWTNVYHISGDHSMTMLTSSIIYLIVNIYGIYKWNKKSIIFDIVKIEEKKQIITIAYIANIISSICYLIITNYIGLIVSIMDIIISLLDSIKINKIIISITAWITIIILIISPITKTWIDYLPLIDLLLYSFIPLIKKNKHIQIIGLINIIIFTIFDYKIKLYNLLIIDIFILILFLYRILKSKNKTIKTY